MPKISLLPPSLVNQIAAGEVIERPASVVKELVENSLDAGAQRIEVRLRKAGRELIEIIDDGCGMTEEDARLSLEQHATSKIASFEDLLQVRTMGFRGEALPSIASISYLTLKTRAAGFPEAFELRVEGGRRTHEGPAAGESGTSIRVEHLFYNVPARRKFLKSDSTELGLCLEVVKALSLAHPEVAFRAQEGRRTLIELPAAQTLHERLTSLFGKTLGPLRQVELTEGPDKLTGFASPVGELKPTRDRLFFFVNGRAVESRIFSLALRDVYGPTMSRGHYPSVFLFLELPASEIDVNVHPAKREIRFRAERERLAFLFRGLGVAVNRELLGHTPAATPSSSLPTFASLASHPPFATRTPTFSAGTLTPFSAAPRLPSLTPTQAPLPLAEAAQRGHGWQFLSLLKKDFALFSTPEGFALVCLPNAQERIAFEKIEASFKAHEAPSQALLTPALLHLEGPLAEALKRNCSFLAQIGFGVEPFGRDTWRLERIPAWLTDANGFTGEPEVLFLAELSALAEDAPADENARHQRLCSLAASHARASAVHPEALDRLVDELLHCQMPLKTPSGAPTLWHLTTEELQKKFER